MTRAEQHRFKRALEAFLRDATVDEDAARAALQKTGIFTKSGKVTANYGGGKSAPKRKSLAADPAAPVVSKTKRLTAA